MQIRPLQPVPVCSFHAGLALRETVTVVRAAGDVGQQFVHGFIQFFVGVVGHLQLIFAVRTPRGVVWVEVKALDVFNRAFLTAYELAVVLNAQGEQDGSDLWLIGVTRSRRPSCQMGAVPIFCTARSRPRDAAGSCRGLSSN